MTFAYILSLFGFVFFAYLLFGTILKQVIWLVKYGYEWFMIHQEKCNGMGRAWGHKKTICIKTLRYILSIDRSDLWKLLWS